MNIKLTNINEDDVITAAMLAKQFDREYPDKIGFSAGVGHMTKDGLSFYIYRTKTGIVVRGYGDDYQHT